MMLTNHDIERLARAIHDDYQRLHSQRGGMANGSAWGDVPEAHREASRGQARDVEAKVHELGLRIVPLAEARVFHFSDEDIERLAPREHARWVEHKRCEGWRRGTKDLDLKQHPSMAPYGELSEEEREKDRDTVRRLPAILRLLGLGLRVASNHDVPNE